MLIYNISNE